MNYCKCIRELLSYEKNMLNMYISYNKLNLSHKEKQIVLCEFIEANGEKLRNTFCTKLCKYKDICTCKTIDPIL